ncbi:GH25 family lysozyme [Lentilactobacillus kribbianus]|uniref:GH25 family lysozyme n=1 Tax=Lentilactobacillus kribbianus TaxID=2729622 RepID=UPI00155722F6|nr:GH25 family lysozyme [Lentilactobacillus kribbianus]
MLSKFSKVIWSLAVTGGVLVGAQQVVNAETTLSKKPAGTMGSSYPVKQYNAFARSRTSIKYNNSVPDLSEWQGNFTDSQVKKLKSQTPFVILRVQYGSDYYDRTFDHNVALMKKYKVPYGVYSFSQYSSPSDAKTEAKDLYKRAPNAKFYVNDYEDQTVSGNTNTAATNWYNTIKPLAGSRKVLLYSYASFMASYASKAVNDYDGFWLAAYQSSEPNTYKHVLWQYTDSYYSSALGQAVDASISSSKDSSWFLNGSSGNSSTPSTPTPTGYAYTYSSASGKYTVKNDPGHAFYNHVKYDKDYKSTKKHNGATYAGKNVTVDMKAKRTDGKGGYYYRTYYNGTNIGWISEKALASQITYKDANIKVRVKAKPASNFYNHVTNSKYTVKKTHNGATYANKVLTVDQQGIKYGWKTPYYRTYDNGKLVGWIYNGSVSQVYPVSYTSVKKTYTVKTDPGHAFYNHVPNGDKYVATKKHNGATYAGKKITVDMKGTQANSKKDTYYRAYYNGKNIGWIHAASLK